LWQGVSGVNNPCPSGFRVPTDAELIAERLTWGSSDAAGAFASPLKLPLAGYRSDGNNGRPQDLGSWGGCWSSNLDGVYAKSLGFEIYESYNSSQTRYYGMSVRCIKD
jgi:hypothetical protein